MNFEVKGQPYFLNFVASEGQWFVFTPLENGIRKIPVSTDLYFDTFFAPASDEEQEETKVS